MVLDASAILAILLNEPERPNFLEKLAADPIRLLAMVGYVEASFVILSRRGANGVADLLALLDRAEIERVPLDTTQAEIAIEAFQRFGKGRHVAALNIGDCFAYALARSTGEALLFKGNDFSRTDIQAA